MAGQAPAWAADLSPIYSPQPATVSPFYVGVGLSWTHHTGYVPPGTTFSIERYVLGGKIFGGYRFSPSWQVETTFHYLGRATLDEGLPALSTERSYAIASSIVYVSPPLSNWFWTPVPTHFLVRAGLAYKDITQLTTVGDFHEGILSGVVGASLEFRITPKFFARLEYEFLSTSIGGPRQPVPALNSLFSVSFGGTRRVVNVMNTPLSVSVGYNF
jgi:hypothetical protein